MAGKRLKQVVSGSPAPEAAFLPQPVSEIPWGHNIRLVESLPAGLCGSLPTITQIEAALKGAKGKGAGDGK